MLALAVLAATGLIYLGIGAIFTWDVVGWSRVLGVELTTPPARIDVRATYGGLMLAIGAFFLLAAARPDMRAAGLWLALLSYAGLALARGGGMLAGERPDARMVIFLVLEIVGAGLAGLALAGE